MATGEVGGCAILTARLLCIFDWRSGPALLTHASYRVPDLRLVPTSDQKTELARFREIGKAGAYLAFMRGESIDPRVFR